MRILHVINSLGAGGAEKLVVDMCVAFSAQGLKVTVLLLDGTPTPLFEKLKEHSVIDIICLETSKSIYNPLFVFKIKKIIKKFDIVHVHLFPSSYWVALPPVGSYNALRMKGNISGFRWLLGLSRSFPVDLPNVSAGGGHRTRDTRSCGDNHERQ